MTDHNVDCVVEQDCCKPSVDCPVTTQNEPCTGTLTGTINGTVTMEPCCCHRLYSRTFVVDIGPRNIAALITFIQSTASAWEAGGYVVLAHSLTDTGANWLLGLTIGWYQP